MTRHPDLNGLRRWLLLILLASMPAVGTELLLLEHTESVWQWVPIVMLGAGTLWLVVTALVPNRATLLVLRAIMALFVVAGGIGIFLHYTGNVEFELEMQSALAGGELFGKAMMGATPVLAAGTMAQLGLLGLAFTFRHPRLAAATTTRE